MVKNLLKKEEEEALKMLGGDKAVKEKEEGEKSAKEEVKKVGDMEDEILSEFVPGVVTKPVSPFLALERKEPRRLEEHAAEARMPKNEGEEKKEVKYMAPMYGEKGYEEKKEEIERPREIMRMDRERIPTSEFERLHGLRPPRMIDSGSHEEVREIIQYEPAAPEESGLPFMKKDDMKKYKRR
jgi:hypothetical protein